MNLLEFTYTKADGTESKRAAIPLFGPTKFVEAIDVSQMPEDAINYSVSKSTSNSSFQELYT